MLLIVVCVVIGNWELLLYCTVLQSGAVSVKTGKVYFQGGYETPNAEGGFNLLSAIGEIPMKSKSTVII